MTRQFYTLAMREGHAEQHILLMAELGAEAFERTQSRHIDRTYGVAAGFTKRIKARLRNELCFGGEGK
jgi:hypothetical protein